MISATYGNLIPLSSHHSILNLPCIHTHVRTHTASSVLQLDEGEEKVRSIPEKRVVLILREIPKETPKQVPASQL